MNITFERVSIACGAMIAVCTVAAGLGYGWPWYSSAEGAALKSSEARHYRSVTVSIQAINRGLDDEHANALLTQKSILLLQKELEAKAHDAVAVGETQARIDWIDNQLAHPNAAPPPPPQ